ncbi:hypothetical protein MTX78_23990 (plasmid) [Hymenobacter tibetensis]|uniref:Uncharacterized protein n=1 Tax=Hymenobacter tibetensis TaxID=497967 RepID=A0ABY4DBC7_9BACT|nr:hypothetical protein [Hymenobacter tibetensis]UOG77408.1 hypothetical protein MTX78_23990 [Hymenobacter tibetensis]
MGPIITWEELQLLDEADNSRSAFAPYTENELQKLLQQAQDPQRLLLLAELLVAAVTDWPFYHLKQPADLVAALQQELGDPLTAERLRLHATGLRQTDRWKVEALRSLLLVLEHAPGYLVEPPLTLPRILAQLTPHWRAALPS